MKKLLVLASLLLLASTAHAGGSEGSIGVGAEYNLFGVGGASVDYDGGDFHAGGFLGFADGDGVGAGANTRIDLGGRFFWHVHSTAMSDFGVGGILGFQHEAANMPMGDDVTNVYFDLGVQIRAFITSNVALSATIGLGILSASDDNDGVVLSGDRLATGGIHYYFF